MSNKWIIPVFFILIFVSGCSKEEIKSNNSDLLSEIIIGTWEEREQLGFPLLKSSQSYIAA